MTRIQTTILGFILVWTFGSAGAQSKDGNFEILALGTESLCLQQTGARLSMIGNRWLGKDALVADMLWGVSAECVCLPKRFRTEQRSQYPNWYGESNIRIAQWKEECRVQEFRNYAPLICSAAAAKRPTPHVDEGVCGCLAREASSLSNQKAEKMMYSYLKYGNVMDKEERPDAPIFGEVQNECEARLRSAK